MLKYILLGIAQGITEFFPVSSSGHLVIAQKLLGMRGEEVIPLPVRVPLHVRPRYVALMLDHWVDCLRREREPEVTPAEARQALATVLALVESARTGQRVTLRD